MPNYKRLFVFAAFFLLMSLQKTHALKCYTCSSFSFSTCNDPFDIEQYTFSADCADPTHVCLKHRSEDTIVFPEELKRGCVSENYCEFEHTAQFCEVCRSDLCNSSSVVGPSAVLIFLLICYCFLPRL